MRIGRVYKIIVNCSNEVYVGSTFNELRFRWAKHKQHYKDRKDGKRQTTTSSFELFDKYGIENCKIILIKEYEIVDKQHLEVYETLWINKLQSINKYNPFCINFLSKKKYYQTRLQKNPNYHKEQYQKRLERNPNYQKKQYQKRLERNPNYNKEEYQKTLQKNPNLNKKKIVCECGLEVNKKSHARHKKTKKHNDRLMV